ncbi:A24 family peptidase [Asticcacaulis sp.]|uniref:prepilin peptidase n=1 Tax=Asticcacaulis sp. TaxID=1872648 RepID=UPI00260D0C52|nr:A24 family peptidase [Asticcacaulis sp.]
MSALTSSHVLPDIPAPCLAALGAVVGLVIGSFVTNTTIRSTRGEANLLGRSVCDHCRTPLRWSETIPMVSFLIQGGRCRTCRTQIDPIHFWGEFAGAVVLGLSASLLPLPQALAVGVLGFALLALSLIDIQTFRLPNPLVFMVLVFSGLLSVVRGEGGASLLWAAGVFIVLKVLQFILQRRSGVAALGEGDIKLMSALALWLGSSVAYAFSLASLGALVFIVLTRWKGRIPFGPFLAAGSLLTGLVVETRMLV